MASEKKFRLGLETADTPQKLDQLQKLFDGLKRVVDNLNNSMKNLEKGFIGNFDKRAVSNIRELTSALKALNTVANAIRVGDPDKFLRLAELKAAINQIRAAPAQIAATIASEQAKAAKSVADIVRNLEKIDQAKNLQRVAASGGSIANLTDAAQARVRMEAQALKVAEAYAKVQQDGLQSSQMRLNKEITLYNQLKRKVEELTAVEKRRRELEKAGTFDAEKDRLIRRTEIERALDRAADQKYLEEKALVQEMVRQAQAKVREPFARQRRLELLNTFDPELDQAERNRRIRRAEAAANDPAYIAALAAAERKRREQVDAINAPYERERRLRRAREFDPEIYNAQIDRQIQQMRARASRPDLLREQAATALELKRAQFNSQGAAEFLFGVQQRLLINYSVINAVVNSFRFLTRFVGELDREFRQLQAITGTTNTEMRDLEKTIVQVSKASKFSAVDVAQAATVLGQAGFSADEIQKTIGAVTMLATATGSTLAQSVDIASSAISVFNLRAEEMGFVANVLTQALNISKLDMQKLALGFQYAANTAADAGIGIIEFTNVLSLLANSGIRSGSTLGTGLRQLMIDLSNPTEKLMARMRELGLTMQQLDIRANGFIGVLKNLREAGFSSADAFATIEVRAANAYSALARSLDQADTFAQQLVSAGAAARANAVQMESLSNTFARFANVAGTTFFTATSGIADAMQKLLAAITGVLNALSNAGPTLEVLGSAFGAAALAGVGAYISRITGLTKALSGVSLAAGAASLSLTGLAAASKALLFSPQGIATVGIFAAIAILTEGFGLLSNSMKDAQEVVDELQAKFDKSRGEIDSTNKSVDAITKQIDDLASKAHRLNTHQNELANATREVRERFGQWGLEIDGNVSRVEDLIGALQKLRRQMTENLSGDLQIAINNNDALIRQLEANARVSQASASTKIASMLGVAMEEGTNQFRSRFDKEAFQRLSPAEQQAILGTLPTANPSVQSLDTIIAALTAEVSNLRKYGGDPKRIETLDAVLKEVQTLRTQLSEIQGRRLQGEDLVRAKAVEDFRLRFGQSFLNRLEEMRTSRSTLEQMLLGEGSTQDSEARVAYAKDLRNAMLVSVERMQADINKLSPEDRKIFDERYADKFRSFIVELDRLVRKTEDESLAALRKTLEQEINILDRRINFELDKVNAEATPSEIHQIEDVLFNPKDGLIIRRNALAMRLARNVKARDFAPNLRDAFLANEQTDAQRRIEAAQLKIAKQLEQAAEGGKDRLPGLPNFQGQLKAIGIAGQTEIERATEARRAIEAQINAQDSPQNRYRISRVQLAALDDQLRQARINELFTKSQVSQQQALDYARIAQESEKAIDSRNAKLREIQQTLQSVNLSEKTRKELEQDEAKLKQQLTTLTGNHEAILRKMDDAQREANESLAEYNALTEELIEDDIPTILDKAAYQWARGAGVFDSITKTIGDNAGQVFGEASRAASQFFTDFTTGTKSAGSAFKDFALGLLRSMHQVVNDMLARQFIYMLFGLGKGFISGFGAGESAGSAFTRSSTTLSNDLGGFGFGSPYATGGYIRRAASGMYVPTRDSVLIKAMPGEYILRESAVRRIGRETLDAINADGNRIVQKSMFHQPANENEKERVLNVWVVSPDQVPPPSEDDIIATVARNIDRGGTLKQLIKQVRFA